MFINNKKILSKKIKKFKMNKKILTLSIAIFAVALVSAAVILFLYPYEPLQPPQANDAGSTSEGIQEVVNANNKFAFDLYHELSKKEEGNIFYSPYSISSALAITYEGAKGKTAQEIKQVFHFPENTILRPNFAAIYNKINEKNKAYELRTGNALWVQKDYPLLEDYKNRVEEYYGGKAAEVDFVKETEKSRKTINSFIEEQTNKKIKELIPKGILGRDTVLVITNAIYFKGIWEWEFDKKDTREMDFKITPENVVKVQMMYMKPDKARFNYADLDKLQILELPYKGDQISMLILLPKQGTEYNYETGEKITYNYTLDDIELTAEKLEKWKSQMKETKLDAIYLPKFEFKTKYFMKKTLSDMGMPTAFSPGADFSGMNGFGGIWIDEVIHQAYIDVNEEGTEAAAATAVIMIKSAAIEKTFKADHPFIFIILDKRANEILFLGRVVNPSL